MYSKCCGQLFIVPVTLECVLGQVISWTCGWMLKVDMLLAVQIGQDWLYTWGLMSDVRWSAGERIPEKRPEWLLLPSILCVVWLQPCTQWKLTAYTQDVRSDGDVIGVTSQKGDQWYYQLNWTVCFRYKVVHSGNRQIWQIWEQIFNTQDCPCEALGHAHK